MKAIVHQHVHPQRSAKALREFGEVMKEELIVRLGVETGLAVVAALNNVYG
jgi:hypothetical protein